MDETEDRHLALEAGRGDRAAFSRLVERHYDRIHALAWRFTGGPPECEDLAQDVCIALGSKIRSYRGEARFTTWLYQVVLNAARDARRRSATRTKATQAFAEIDQLRRDEDSARANEADILRSAINTLKDDLRETAVLVLDEGLNHRETAEILDVKESTVSWRLMEVRKALKAKFSEEGSMT